MIKSSNYKTTRLVPGQRSQVRRGEAVGQADQIRHDLVKQVFVICCVILAYVVMLMVLLFRTCETSLRAVSALKAPVRSDCQT